MKFKLYRIQPREFISGSFIMDYSYYTKREAISLYLAKFPQFKRNEIIIE